MTASATPRRRALVHVLDNHAKGILACDAVTATFRLRDRDHIFSKHLDDSIKGLGLVSAANFRALARGGGKFLMAMTVRPGNEVAESVLARPGRYEGYDALFDV